MTAANDNTPCLFFLRKPVAFVESSVMIHINDLARHIVTLNQEAEYGPFTLEQYTPSEQLALLAIRSNDPMADAILARLKHSTVGGMDFLSLRKRGLAEHKPDGRFHRFTPRGQWVSTKVRQALADKFEVRGEREIYNMPRVYSQRQQQRYTRSRYNWANR